MQAHLKKKPVTKTVTFLFVWILFNQNKDLLIMLNMIKKNIKKSSYQDIGACKKKLNCST